MWYQFTINATKAQTTRQGCFKMRLAPVSIFRLRPIVYNVIQYNVLLNFQDINHTVFKWQKGNWVSRVSLYKRWSSKNVIFCNYSNTNIFRKYVQFHFDFVNKHRYISSWTRNIKIIVRTQKNPNLISTIRTYIMTSLHPSCLIIMCISPFKLCNAAWLFVKSINQYNIVWL